MGFFFVSTSVNFFFIFNFFLLCFNLAYCSIRRIESRKGGNLFEEVSHFVLQENDLEAIALKNPFGSSTAFVSLFLDLPPLAEEIPGLFHLFEHVILEGGGKKNGESFSRFITSKSGNYHGTTKIQGIHLGFHIDSIFLEEALKRFSNLFLLPNFCDENIEDGDFFDERKAVVEEFQEKMKNDVQKTLLMSRLHQDPPLSNFFGGNSQTLGSADRILLLKALRTLYETKVSSHLMKLVITSGLPTSQVEEYISRFFSRIPKRVGAFEFHWPLEFKSNQLILFESEELNQILINLPVPIDPNFPHHLRIFEYVSYLLNSITEGSWLNHFKNKLLIANTAMSHDILGHHANIIILLFTASNPVKLMVPLIRTFQQYLEYLKEHAVDRDLYDEFKSSFKRKKTIESTDPSFLDNISLQMKFNRNAVDWLLLDNMEFDAEVISRCLSAINPELLNVTMAWNKAGMEKLDLFDPYHQIPYKKTSLDIKSSASDIKFVPQLLPKNEFSFLEEFYYKPLFHVVNEYYLPFELVPGLWFKNDFIISSPEVALKLRFLIQPDASLIQRLMIALYFKLIYASIYSKIDRAEQAGMEIKIDTLNLHSIIISIFGFGRKIPIKFLKIILEKFSALQVDETIDWEDWRSYFKLMKNSLKPYSAGPDFVVKVFSSYLSHGDNISDDLFDQVIEGVTFDEFKNFVKEGNVMRFLSVPIVFVTGTCLTKENALKVNSYIREASYGLSLSGAGKCPFVENRVVELKSSHQDFACVVIFKMTTREDDIKGFALALLLDQMLNHHFYERLRLVEQLAYTIGLTHKNSQNESFLLFYIQSSSPLAEFEFRIMKYLHRDAVDYLDSLSDSYLSDVYNSAIQSLASINIRFHDEVEALWYSIPNFKLKGRIRNFLETEYSLEQFQTDAREFLLESKLRDTLRIVVTPQTPKN